MNLGGFGDLAKLAKSDRAAAEQVTDFEPPIYNIWKQQEKSGRKWPLWKLFGVNWLAPSIAFDSASHSVLLSFRTAHPLPIC